MYYQRYEGYNYYIGFAKPDFPVTETAYGVLIYYWETISTRYNIVLYCFSLLLQFVAPSNECLLCIKSNNTSTICHSPALNSPLALLLPLSVLFMWRYFCNKIQFKSVKSNIFSYLCKHKTEENEERKTCNLQYSYTKKRNI